MSAAVSPAQQLGLLGKLPVEIRHRIYHFVGLRDTRYILKMWFERVDPAIDTTIHVPQPVATDDDDGDNFEEGQIDEDDDEDEDEDEDDNEETEEPEDEQADDEDEEMENANDMDEDTEEDYEDDVDVDDGSGIQTGVTTIAATTTAVNANSTRELPQRHTKYRHTVNMFQLDRAPPPVNLLLLNRQISHEAYNYVYNTAGMAIDLNRGFAHFTMFEDTIYVLRDDASTPLRHVKKVQVNIFWDTEWIRTNRQKTNVELITNILNIRAQLVLSLLLLMPNVTDIKITWHDTEHADEAVATLASIKDIFLPTAYGGNIEYANKTGSPINFVMDEIFEEAGTEYDAESRLGELRTELDRIAAGIQIS